MKKSNNSEEILIDLVNNFIDQSGLRKRFQEQEIIQKFHKIIGPFLMKKVKKSFVKNQKLYLNLSSAPFKQELILQKSKLLNQINSSLGKEYLKDLIFI